MVRCKNCGWYDSGICILESTEADEQPVFPDGYCKYGVSKRKNGLQYEPKTKEKE
jgi:hypothetical protein